MKKESINSGSGSAPSDDYEMLKERIRKMIREDPELIALLEEQRARMNEKEKNNLAAC